MKPIESDAEPMVAADPSIVLEAAPGTGAPETIGLVPDAPMTGSVELQAAKVRKPRRRKNDAAGPEPEPVSASESESGVKSASSSSLPVDPAAQPAGSPTSVRARSRKPRAAKPSGDQNSEAQASGSSTVASDDPPVAIASTAMPVGELAGCVEPPAASGAGDPAQTSGGADRADGSMPAPDARATASEPPARERVRIDDANEDLDEDEEPDEEEDDLDRAKRQALREQRDARPPQPISFSDVVSGQFDADETNEAVPVLKRVLLPEADAPKLHKVLAQAGLGSRLEMEQLILQGRISVNNEPAHIGQRIQFGDTVKFNGKPVRFRIAPPPARVIAYHKPTGEVVTHDDPQNRPTVFRKLPRLQQGKWQSVGRLDLNTEGLLLFTSSGELANQLMHPRFGLEREYAVRVLGALSKEEKARLLEGVRLDDGQARFGTIEEGGGEGSNCWYRVTISEGRNREVRRMFEAVGHAVSRLIRIRYGAMMLPRGLKRGAWMELDDGDIRSLMRAAGDAAGVPRPAPGPRDEGRGRGGRSSNNNNNNDRRRGERNGSGGPRGASAGSPAGTIPDPLGMAGEGGRGPARPAGGRGRAPAKGGGQGPQARTGGGGAKGRSGEARASGAAQPDPMKTSLGYIGADSFSRQRKDQRQGPARRGGPGGAPAGGPRRNRGR